MSRAPGKLVTDEEMADVSARYATTSNAQLASEMRCTVQRIRDIAYKLGLKKDPAYVRASYARNLASSKSAPPESPVCEIPLEIPPSLEASGKSIKIETRNGRIEITPVRGGSVTRHTLRG